MDKKRIADKLKEMRWWLIALAIYFAVAGSARLAAREREREMEAELKNFYSVVQTVIGERNNASEMSKQWEKQYREALEEIAALKAENEALNAKVEELTRMFEETSFALDEVAYETGWTSLGTFSITHFCNCKTCCGKWANGLTASGTVPVEGRTVAVDPNVIPLGSKIRINGHEYIAEDTGVSGHVIDVFVNDHQYAIQLGTYRANVEKAV